MKLKVKGLKVPSCVLVWTEGAVSKALKVTNNLNFEVADEHGHKLLGSYPELLEIVSYGKVKKAMPSAPENKMIEAEETKGV